MEDYHTESGRVVPVLLPVHPALLGCKVPILANGWTAVGGPAAALNIEHPTPTVQQYEDLAAGAAVSQTY